MPSASLAVQSEQSAVCTVQQGLTTVQAAALVSGAIRTCGCACDSVRCEMAHLAVKHWRLDLILRHSFGFALCSISIRTSSSRTPKERRRARIRWPGLPPLAHRRHQAARREQVDLLLVLRRCRRGILAVTTAIAVRDDGAVAFVAPLEQVALPAQPRVARLQVEAHKGAVRQRRQRL